MISRPLSVLLLIASVPYFVMAQEAQAIVQVPANLDKLWAGFEAMDRDTPLETEVLKEWEDDGLVCRVVRFQVGVFKGSPSRVAAFYVFPKGAKRLPGLLQLHGGGQSAGLSGAIADAANGYASLSLNWGGNKLNFGSSKQGYDGPQTDWGKLDATHPPQRNKTNHFAGPLTPDAFTLDAVESPRNSNWFVVLMAARRALTFLEKQPEVDGARLGVYGHSMGGKLTTNLAAIDPRVKAAVPSCGGAGVILESQADLPGCVKTKPGAMEISCVADNSYLARLRCPILWLSPTNDFHAPPGNMAWNWRNLPDALTRFSNAPHLNHRHTAEHQITQNLWFDQHLKGGPALAETPGLELNLKTGDGVPAVRVKPAKPGEVLRVDVYYSTDPHELTRFWRDAQAVRAGDTWEAKCPLLSLDQPLFAYANVVYALPERWRKAAVSPGQESAEVFTVSSRYVSVTKEVLRVAGVRATDRPSRLVDDGSRGWHDWFRLNWGHPPLWNATTRKLKDPAFQGPDGAALVFEIRSGTDNQLVVTVGTNAWGAFVPGKSAIDYAVAKPIKGTSEWQTVTVRAEELDSLDPKSPGKLPNWRTVTELSLSPAGSVLDGGVKVSVPAKAWEGPREIRNLRWEGGTYSGKTTTGETASPEGSK